MKKQLGKKLMGAGASAVIASALLCFGSGSALAAGGLDMSTSYPGMSVKPGDTLSVPVTLMNSTGSGLDADVSISSIPDGWEGYLQGGSYEISRVHVENGTGGADMTLHVTVPKEMDEGTYTVELSANAGSAYDTLPITFTVNEVNAGQGSFASEYPQQEGVSGTNFSFSTTLINNGLKPQSYSLSSNAPAGWGVSFTPSGESTKVAGIEVESGQSQSLTVAVTPPQDVAAGEYDITCTAVSASESLSTDLKVVITGTYGLTLTTPDGRLSLDAYANRESDVTLEITNSGNVDLTDVSLNSTLPSGWTATYNIENNIISSIPAGSTSEVIAHIKPGSDAITGDYVATFTAKTGETSASAEFRVSVKTRTVWGLVAVAIIALTLGCLGWVFRKYGRR